MRSSPIRFGIVDFDRRQAIPGVGASRHVDVIVVGAAAGLIPVLVHRRHLMPLTLLRVVGHAVFGGGDGVGTPAHDDQKALEHANPGAAARLRQLGNAKPFVRLDEEGGRETERRLKSW